MTKFWVLHNYGVEGWKIMGRGDLDSVLEAVELREADLGGGGGESVIVQVIDTYEAYRRAEYERDKRDRLRKQESA